MIVFLFNKMNRHLCVELINRKRKQDLGLPENENCIEYLIAHYKQYHNKKYVIDHLPKIFEPYKRQSIFEI